MRLPSGLGERRSDPATRPTAPLRGLSFQLSGHGVGHTAFAAGRVILVNDTTLRSFVESRSIYSQLGLDFALISSRNRRIQLFLLRFDAGEY